MKKFTLLPLLMLMFTACSVDNEDLINDEERFAALNAQASECSANAGQDNFAVYTNPEIDEMVNDFGQVRSLYLGLLDEGVPTDGTFSPSLLTVFRSYNRNNFGDFTTTYTVGEGTCTDSTNLTISVCETIFDAGSDNSVTYTHAYLDEQINDVGQIEQLYRDLLDEGVDTTGTLSRSGQEIYDDYKDNGPGEYTVTYSLGEGNCGDTAELTINITE